MLKPKGTLTHMITVRAVRNLLQRRKKMATLSLSIFTENQHFNTYTDIKWKILEKINSPTYWCIKSYKLHTNTLTKIHTLKCNDNTSKDFLSSGEILHSKLKIKTLKQIRSRKKQKQKNAEIFHTRMPCIVVVRTQFWVLRRHLQNKEKGCKKKLTHNEKAKSKTTWKWKPFSPPFYRCYN